MIYTINYRTQFLISSLIIIQFGNYSSVPDSSDGSTYHRTINFPISFTSLNYYMSPVSILSHHTENGYHTIYNKEVSKCKIIGTDKAGVWFAVGF